MKSPRHIPARVSSIGSYYDSGALGDGSAASAVPPNPRDLPGLEDDLVNAESLTNLGPRVRRRID